MLRFVTLLAATVAIAIAAPNPANVFEIDISPEEAQRFLSSPPFSEPQLSGRNAVLPLVRYDSPNFRSAEAGPTLGHYWKNGHEIENTDDYVEEVYDAAQFHGQDGLGGYAYGYQAPESSKVENRERSGDVTGSYTYRAGNNELIKVRYWADSEGFHQEDNLPKVVLQPVQEADDVRQARLAHEKAWQEAAAAAAQQPDPQGEYQDNYEYHGAASEQQSVVSVPAQAPVAREGKAYASAQAQAYRPQQQYSAQQQGFAAPGFAAQQYSAQAYASQGQGQKYSGEGPAQKYPIKEDEVEPTGPPRGFFYSFTYPVSVIASKSAGQAGGLNPGSPVDHDTVSVSAQRG